MKPIKITVSDLDGIEIDSETFDEHNEPKFSKRPSENTNLFLAKHYMRYFVIPRIAPGQVIRIEEVES